MTNICTYIDITWKYLVFDWNSSDNFGCLLHSLNFNNFHWMTVNLNDTFQYPIVMLIEPIQIKILILCIRVWYEMLITESWTGISSTYKWFFSSIQLILFFLKKQNKQFKDTSKCCSYHVYYYRGNVKNRTWTSHYTSNDIINTKKIIVVFYVCRQ